MTAGARGLLAAALLVHPHLASAQQASAQALLQEAFDLLETGAREAALPKLEQALAQARAAGEVGNEARAQRGFGLAREAARDLPGARERYLEALRLAQSVGDRREAGQARLALGTVAWMQNDWKSLREHTGAAAADFEAVGDKALQAQALSNMVPAADLDDDRRATLVETAWALVADTSDKHRQGLVLQRWGDVLTRQGEYARAAAKLERAVALLEASGLPRERVSALTSLGRSYRLHGLPERALPFYERAAALAETIGDKRLASQSQGAIAVAYNGMERHREGVAAAQRSLALAREAAVDNQIALALGNLAGLLIDAGEFEKALPLLDKLMATSDSTYRETHVHARRQRAHALRGLGRLDEALAEADRSVALAEADQAPDPLLRSLAERAEVRSRAGDGKGALEDARRALALVEAQRARLVPRDFMKQGFVDRHQELFTLTIDLLERVGQSASALETAERARARAFLDLLATRDASPGAATPGGDLLSAAFVGPPRAEDVQALAARLSSTILSYWVARDVAFVWSVTPDGSIRLRRIPVSARRLETLARRSTEGVTGESATGTRGGGETEAETPPTILPGLLTRGGASLTLGASHVAALRELYDLLVRPARGDLPQQAGGLVTIVPYGPLYRVSFAALLDEDGRYLVERYRTHYAPSIRVLELAARKAAPETSPPRALLVADPELRAAGIELPPLPGSRQEVGAVERSIGQARAQVLLAKDASERRVRELCSDRSILHFATHGVLSERDPLTSFLALGGEPGTPDGDGRLTAQEIYELRLHARLVVLSACRSGAGRITGDGVFGLTRAFLYAGAPSVLAALWDVADEPARSLLPRFYEGWLRAGDTSGALRAAQIQLIQALRSGRVEVATPLGPVRLPEHPALWAAFVLVGEP